MVDPALHAESSVDDQLILLAASNHNLEALRTLLRTGSANVQDPDTGYTPLHCAIAACEVSAPASPITTNHVLPGELPNGHSSNGSSAGAPPGTAQDDVNNAEKIVRLLFQNGAIWNDLDKNNETPGCLARRLGLNSLYELIVDAGVRAEMLLNRLDGYEVLPDEDDDEEDLVEEALGSKEASQLKLDDPSTKDEHDAGSEQLNGVTSGREPSPGQTTSGLTFEGDLTNETYLLSNLTFSHDRLVDDDRNGVMMTWETGIMQRTANLLAPATGLRILNIGHGMGIIDDFFQTKSPSQHHIIEAHPAVIAQLKKNGWDKKSGVTIHEGKWQDVVPKLIDEAVSFDAIYFDTFAEDYKALHKFFEEYVLGLLDDGGKWGFFNGLGADRQVCYDVYAKVVEIDLLEAGYDVEWETIPIQDLEQSKQWDGVKRPYWQLESYRLPVCTIIE